MHQIEPFIPNGTAVSVALMKGYFERRVATEQLIGTLSAQRHAEAVAVHLFSCEERADGTSHQIGFERFGDLDNVADGRKNLVAVRLEWHHAQIEAGSLRILGGIGIVGRSLTTDKVARRFRPELSRIVGDQRTVDAATE